MDNLYTKDGVHDLVLLDDINESTVNGTLKKRHGQDKIYTYIGNVLISVNPFKMIKGLYTQKKIMGYKNRFLYENPPHIYAIAEDSYRMLRTEHEDQCVIICGESGAGKTEASKLIMQYIAAVSGSGKEIERVKNQILKSNPVLEAFGNAKTLRNNNSSRFGKYMEIFFDFKADPVGSIITNYLLEKSRVVNPSIGERGFHIFYQLCSGLTTKEKEKFQIYDSSDYYYLSKSECFKVNNMDDKKWYKETIDGMEAMGMKDGEIAQVIATVSAVLWIGQLDFKKGNGNKTVIRDDQPVEIISYLLQCPKETIESAMSGRTITTYNDSVKTNFSIEQAYATRDALAKMLYSKLFNFIVSRVNAALDISNVTQKEFDPATSRVIGVLDIYGFEIFDYNSFEQFCINYVNEKLQQIFIEKTLKIEQEEYLKEGIEWQEVDYFNNKIVCDLIEHKQGILGYLNEECLLGEGTDKNFLRKITERLNDHEHFWRDLQHENEFVVHHYAGGVCYNVDGFLEKNKDSVWKDLLTVGEQSQASIFREMFTEGKSNRVVKRPPTAGTQFKKQVNGLMKRLGQCRPHYVRCIKPNDKKAAGVYNQELSLNQVRYLGLVENVRVRRAGYAFRMTFERFMSRYKMIAKETWPNWDGDGKSGCVKICNVIGLKIGQDYQLGKTKVFLRRPDSLFAFEDARNRRLHDLATMIQKAYKSWKARKFFLELRKKALGLYKGKKARRRCSVKRYYCGDYMEAKSNVRMKAILSKFGDGKLLFADQVMKVNKKFKQQSRALILTDKHVYNMKFPKYKVQRKVALANITGVSLSKHPDDLFVIHVLTEYDYVIISDRKTEFLTALKNQMGEMNIQLKLNFTESIEVKNKRKKLQYIKFMPNKFNRECRYEKEKGKKDELTVHVGDVDIVNDEYLKSIAPNFMEEKSDSKYKEDRFSKFGNNRKTFSARPTPNSNAHKLGGNHKKFGDDRFGNDNTKKFGNTKKKETPVEKDLGRFGNAKKTFGSKNNKNVFGSKDQVKSKTFNNRAGSGGVKQAKFSSGAKKFGGNNKAGNNKFSGNKFGANKTVNNSNKFGANKVSANKFGGNNAAKKFGNNSNKFGGNKFGANKSNNSNKFGANKVNNSNKFGANKSNNSNKFGANKSSNKFGGNKFGGNKVSNNASKFGGNKFGGNKVSNNANKFGNKTSNNANTAKKWGSKTAQTTTQSPPKKQDEVIPSNVWCVALYDFESREESELSFKQGEYIWCFECDDSGWIKGEKDGVQGFVPSTYVAVSEQQ